MFVACSTLCFSNEPLESALRHIAELEFDKMNVYNARIERFGKRNPRIPGSGSREARPARINTCLAPLSMVAA